MPRFQRGAPVKRDKHEITWSNLGQNASTGVDIIIAKTVDVGAKGSLTETSVGSHVRAVYFEFHFGADDVTNANVIHWKIQIKRPNQTMTIPNSYYQDDRSQIIKRGMEMLPANRAVLFKRTFVVLVPKVYQRQKQASEILFSYQASSTQLINACGIAIYKEIY